MKARIFIIIFPDFSSTFLQVFALMPLHCSLFINHLNSSSQSTVNNGLGKQLQAQVNHHQHCVGVVVSSSSASKLQLIMLCEERVEPRRLRELPHETQSSRSFIHSVTHFHSFGAQC